MLSSSRQIEQRPPQQAAGYGRDASGARAPWVSWYYRQRWRKRRNRQLQAEPLCAMHLANGEVVPARVADHVIHHEGDPHAFWHGALQSLCFDCHNRHKKHEEAHGFSSAIGLDGWPIDPAHPVYATSDRTGTTAAQPGHQKGGISF